MLIPFTDKERGAARINASLRSFAKPGTWFAPMWAIMVGAIGSPNSHWDRLRRSAASCRRCSWPARCSARSRRSSTTTSTATSTASTSRTARRPPTSSTRARSGSSPSCSRAPRARDRVRCWAGRSATSRSPAWCWRWRTACPPIRLKARNGWLANAACAFSYEGFAWLAGAAAFGSHHDRHDRPRDAVLAGRARPDDAQRFQEPAKAIARWGCDRSRSCSANSKALAQAITFINLVPSARDGVRAFARSSGLPPPR